VNSVNIHYFSLLPTCLYSLHNLFCLFVRFLVQLIFFSFYFLWDRSFVRSFFCWFDRSFFLSIFLSFSLKKNIICLLLSLFLLFAQFRTAACLFVCLSVSFSVKFLIVTKFDIYRIVSNFDIENLIYIVLYRISILEI
jgi:hypothetical protein